MLVKIVKFAVTSECRHDEVVSVKKTSRVWGLEVASSSVKMAELCCALAPTECFESTATPFCSRTTGL
ncbi:unnamed protein product [Ixodes pacificus]